MYFACYAVSVALGYVTAVVTQHGHPAELPPIFAPLPIAKPAPAPRPQSTGSGISERVRLQLTERVLAEAKAFAVPDVVGSNVPTAGPVNVDGAIMMTPFTVKSLTLSRRDVEIQEEPLRRFVPVSRVSRKANALSATLLRVMGGEVKLNVVNGAGMGVDHAIDFTRVEIEFSYRW
jgi:hypothetical protein